MNPVVQPSFWSDPEIEVASAETKLAVLWLITNSQTSIIGLCRATSKRFAFETGLQPEALAEACSQLPRMLCASSEGVWIRNYIRHQFGSGEKLTRNNCFRSISSAFEQVRDEALRSEISSAYPEFGSPSQALTKPLPTPSEGLERGKRREEKSKSTEEKGMEDNQQKEEEPAKQSELPILTALSNPNPQDEKKAALRAIAPRVGAIMHRRPETRWSEKEKAALAALYPLPDEDVKLIEDYYRAPIPEDKNFRRRDLLTLLNNWPGELDRARRHFGSTQPAAPVGSVRIDRWGNEIRKRDAYAVAPAPQPQPATRTA